MKGNVECRTSNPRYRDGYDRIFKNNQGSKVESKWLLEADFTTGNDPSQNKIKKKG